MQRHWLELLRQGDYAQINRRLNALQIGFEERRVSEDELFANFEPFEALLHNSPETASALDAQGGL